MQNDVIVGVDEAGRGPWAGPLVAAAVMVDAAELFGRICDSKQASAKRRTVMRTRIQTEAHWIGIGWVPAVDVDRLGLQEATKYAMERAYAQIPRSEATIIVDGHINYLSGAGNSSALIRADSEVPAVSAASIIAKTFRDDYMRHLDSIYPEYGFSAHKGYGTKSHTEALNKHGTCPEHRRSFAPIRKYSLAS